MATCAVRQARISGDAVEEIRLLLFPEQGRGGAQSQRHFAQLFMVERSVVALAEIDHLGPPFRHQQEERFCRQLGGFLQLKDSLLGIVPADELAMFLATSDPELGARPVQLLLAVSDDDDRSILAAARRWKSLATRS